MKKKVKGVTDMAKVTLDWKAPSERKMADFVGGLDNEKKKAFATACVTKKDGKVSINKSKAKKWLVDNFDNTDDIEWNNRPEKKVKKLSGADTIAEWLEL